MTKSKKGGAYERKFSKKLSLWWSSGRSPDLFWRTPGSGGKATIDGRGTHAGDVRAVLPEGEGFTELFTVELKRGYPDADFQRVLDGAGSNHQIIDFMKQAHRDHQLAGSKYWMLVVARDRKKELVVLPYDCWSKLYQLLYTPDKSPTVNVELELDHKTCVVIFRLEDLLKLDPQQVYEALK